MGRRPNAAKTEAKAHLDRLGSTGTPHGELHMQPMRTSPPVERVELQPENTNLSSQEADLQPKMQATPATKWKTRKLKANSTPRRSVRLKNVVLPPLDKEIERVIEEVTLSESEKEDEQPIGEEENLPKFTFNEKNLGEKINHLIQLLEDQRETMKSSTSKNFTRNDSSCGVEINYKGLYIDSQKKIEALTDENYHLTMKLQNALGKVEAYEKGTLSLTTALEKLKELIMVSNLAKATETMNVTSQVIREALDTSHEARTSPRRKNVTARRQN